MNDILILSASRTPIGSLNGTLANSTAPQLAAKASADALAKSGVKPEELGEVVLGCVIPAGIGQAPARMAAIAAGIPVSVGATTVNKVCGSGMKAVMMASQSIALGEEDYALAGGMESMSKAPYLLDKARTGYRYGDAKLLDAVLKDGLIDPYDGVHMGDCGELCAKEHSITREMQDEWAVRSYARARGPGEGLVQERDRRRRRRRARRGAGARQARQGEQAASGVPEGRNHHRG